MKKAMPQTVILLLVCLWCAFAFMGATESVARSGRFCLIASGGGGYLPLPEWKDEYSRTSYWRPVGHFVLYESHSADFEQDKLGFHSDVRLASM
jgi:hypothetical protein